MGGECSVFLLLLPKLATFLVSGIRTEPCLLHLVPPLSSFFRVGGVMKRMKRVRYNIHKNSGHPRRIRGSDRFKKEVVLPINSELQIPLSEFLFTPGAGKAAGGYLSSQKHTSVRLSFNLLASSSIPDKLRSLLEATLHSYLTQDGWFHILSSQFQSQARNRHDALARFQKIMTEASKAHPKRMETTTPTEEKQRRQEQNKRQRRKKRERSQRFSA